MNDLHQHNLDYLAAKHAQALIRAAQNDNAKPKEVENTVTKTLGVLQENGVYACFLYLQANKKKDEPDHIIRVMLDLLDEDQLGLPKRENDDVLNYIADKITADLHRLLLAKEALEQMLIYARYGAKAAGKQ